MSQDKHVTLKVVSQNQEIDTKTLLPRCLNAVFENAKATIAPLLSATLSKFDDALFEYANKSEGGEKQDAYFYAMRELRFYRKDIERDFAHVLAQKFVALTKLNKQKNQKKRSLENKPIEAPNELSLVANDKLDIILSRESIIRKASENAKQKLDALQSCFDQVVQKELDTKDMPLGPESLTDALSQSVFKLDIDTRCSLILFKLFDLHVISCLAEMYKSSLAIFSAHGVVAIVHDRTYRSSDSEDDTTSSEQAGQSIHNAIVGRGNAAAPQSQPAQNANLNPQTHYGSNHGGAVQGPPAGYAPASGAPAASLMPALHYLGTHASHKKLIDQKYFIKTLSQVLHKQGKDDALSESQSKEFVLMSQTFADIDSRQELAESTRGLLCSLLVPFSKAMLSQPDYLSKEGSDGRKLLNLLSELDFYWHHDEESRYLQQAKAILNRLGKSTGKPEESINSAVSELKAISDKQNKKIQQLECRLQAAEEGKVKADDVKSIVVKQISAVTNHCQVPRELNNIIQNAWRQVMFFDGLKYGLDSTEWKQDVKVLFRLGRLAYLDGRNVTRSKKYHTKLIKMVEEGLTHIGFHAFKLDKVLTVLRQYTARREQELVKRLAALKKNRDHSKSVKKAVDKPRPIALTLVNVSIKKPSILSDDPVLAPAVAQIEQFTRGQWFDLHIDGKPRRCRLAAIISQTGTYIFVNGQGAKACELSTEKLARDLLSHTIKPVESDHLFDSILEKLIAQRPHQPQSIGI